VGDREEESRRRQRDPLQIDSRGRGRKHEAAVPCVSQHDLAILDRHDEIGWRQPARARRAGRPPVLDFPVPQDRSLGDIQPGIGLSRQRQLGEDDAGTERGLASQMPAHVGLELWVTAAQTSEQARSGRPDDPWRDELELARLNGCGILPDDAREHRECLRKRCRRLAAQTRELALAQVNRGSWRRPPALEQRQQRSLPGRRCRRSRRSRRWRRPIGPESQPKVRIERLEERDAAGAEASLIRLDERAEGFGVRWCDPREQMDAARQGSSTFPGRLAST
jgi:hypothetical protein